MRAFGWIERLWQDLRHAGRMFAKNPAFTAIAVISIAFGTGANVAMFSVADALLLRPLPIRRPSELLTVGSQVTRGIATVNVGSYPDYIDIRDRTRSFSGIVAFEYDTVGLTTRAGAPPKVKLATLVSANFFQVLGVEPEIGRSFRPEEDRAGSDPVVILGYGTWLADFSGDRGVVGRKIGIAGIECTVVGVAPERFSGLHPYVRNSVYLPIAHWPRIAPVAGLDPLTAREYRHLTMKGRLNPGVTLTQAQAELTTIGLALAQAYPATNKDQAPVVQTEFDVRFEQQPLNSGLLVLLTTLSTAVLCVACANVAGLLASRAPVRAREMALRLAIGASRARLVRQLITESLGIALVGGAGGLVVGWIGISLLRQIQFPTEIVAPPVMRLDERAMLFSLVTATASAFLVGLGPAIQTTRVDLSSALKSSEVGVSRRQRLTGRNALVALQVALSLVLLTIAVFAFQVFNQEMSDGPGFRTTQMAKITIDPGQARYTDAEAAVFFDAALEHARELPGARSAAVTSAMPLYSFALSPIVPEDYQLPAGQPSVMPFGNSIDERYFDTMGIPLVEGRGFLTTDTAEVALVAIVNDTLARHYWPGRDAIGRRFRMTDDHGPWVEVVGVVKTTQVGYPGETPKDAVYFPFRQQPHGQMVLLVQTAGDSSAMLAPLRDMVARMDPDVPQYDAQTMEVFYDARVTSIGHVITRLIAGMGVMGMTLTMVGLYGLVSYAVSRRTREIGIRIAVGASYGRILRMILQQGMTPAWFGLAIGLVLSQLTVRFLPAAALVSRRYDPRTFFWVVPLLLAVTVVAAFVPARRAARVQPTVALRCD